MTKLIIDYLDTKPKVNLSVEKGESLIYFLLGIKPGTKEIEVHLKGAGAKAQILGLCLAREGENRISTFQLHEAPNTVSDLLIKSVLDKKTNYIFRGLIQIDRKAQGANAYQRNDSLLLSEQAQVDTKPELEILANDVRCTHGATIGKIDENNLFYLRSRGLSQKKAEQMIVSGFLKDVIERLPQGKEKTELEKRLEKELILN